MKGKTGFVSIISLLIAFSLLTFSFAVADLMSDGGNRLVDLQADITADNAGNGLDDIDPDDGGWDWEILPSETEHSENPSPENLFGVTGDGVLASFQDGGGIRLAISLVDAYYGISGNPDIDSGTDFGFLCRLSDLTGDSSYAKLAKERWDTKMALYGGADSLAILIKESRHSSGYDGLIPWDIGLYIKDGLKLQEYFPGQGYLSDAIDMADVIYGDLTSEEPYFDMYDGYEWFYTFGLEGIVSSFGLLGIYYDYAFNSGVILLENQNIGWGLGAGMRNIRNRMLRQLRMSSCHSVCWMFHTDLSTMQPRPVPTTLLPFRRPTVAGTFSDMSILKSMENAFVRCLSILRR